MSSFASRAALAAFAALALTASPAAAQQKPPGTGGVAIKPESLGIGRAATPAEIKAWDIDVRPDGHGLPEGKGSVKDGEKLYIEKCASCHGDFGEGAARWPYLIGKGKLSDDDPKKSIGSYWPYATTVFDYVKRAMPFGDAQSLTDDQTYAITAYLLHVNDLLPETAVLDRAGLLAIKMPNAAGFVADPRPDVKSVPCMKNCKPAAEIHSEARKIDVTPKDERDPAKGRRVD